MVSVKDKLISTDEIDSVRYDPDENELQVSYSSDDCGHSFSEAEVSLVRQGKLTPLVGDGDSTSYDVHITLDEQQENKESKFNFL